MSKLTIRIEAPTITLEIDNIEALPQALLDGLASLGTVKGGATVSAKGDLEGLAKALHDKAAQMRQVGQSAPASTPAPTPSAEDLPHMDVVGLLLKTRSNHDAVQNLVIPLLRKGLTVKGDPKKVLSDAVNVGRPWSPDTLSRVCALLHAGRHKNFPDTTEIYRAHDKLRRGAADPRETVSEPSPAEEVAA